jgi:lipoprotein-releasing system permease protein
LNLPFFIAKRYLISKKSHNAINIISGISVAGICIGTMALVIVLSAFNGLSDLVQSLYNSFDADIEITIKQGKTFDPNSSEIQSLKNINGVASYTEIMEGNALLKFNDKQCVATIKGVGNEFEAMSGFDSLVHEGRFDISKNNIVLGKGISYVLQTNTDDAFTPISIYAPKRGNSNAINPEDGLNELKVYSTGVFSINDEFDYKYAIMNIDKARELLDYKNEVTSLEIAVNKGADKEQVQQQIIATLGGRYEIKNREQQNAMLYKTLKSERLWTFIILVFILIIAMFNVIGCLTMLIIEKKKDITILHNMGAGIPLIRKIFLVEGMLITLVGAGAGLILGSFICWLQIKFSLVKLTEGYVVNAYPMHMLGIDFIKILIVVLLIGFFAAWYPVRIFTKKHLMT